MIASVVRMRPTRGNRLGREHIVRLSVHTREPWGRTLCGYQTDQSWARNVQGRENLRVLVEVAASIGGAGVCRLCLSSARASIESVDLARRVAAPTTRPTTAIGRLRAMVERYRAVVAGDRPEAEDWARQLDREAAIVLAETGLPGSLPLPDHQPKSPR